jgi:hypothetical protein
MSTLRGLPFERDDGGRKATGFKGDAGDCVIRRFSRHCENG